MIPNSPRLTIAAARFPFRKDGSSKRQVEHAGFAEPLAAPFEEDEDGQGRATEEERDGDR